MRIRVWPALRSLKNQPSGHAQTRHQRTAGIELDDDILAAPSDRSDYFAAERTPKVESRRGDRHLAKTDAHIRNATPQNKATQSAGDRFDFR